MQGGRVPKLTPRVSARAPARRQGRQQRSRDRWVALLGVEETAEAPWSQLAWTARTRPGRLCRGEACWAFASREPLGVLVGLMMLVSDDRLAVESVETATSTCGTGNLVEQVRLQFFATDALFATGEEYVPDLAA